MFIELTINLPERYRLTSIQRFHNGEWIVCVHIHQPSEMMGLHHALGQHADINEAAKLAIEKCEAKATAPQPNLPSKHIPTRTEQALKMTPAIPGLDLSTLDL